MITRYEQHHTSWIDICQPSPDEVREVMEEFGIPPQLMGDLTSPTRHGDAVRAENVIKVTLDFPVVKLVEQEHPQELKFLITKKALITVRYADIAPLHQFAKEFEVVTMLEKAKKTLNGGHLFAAIMHTLYKALEQRLDYISTRLTDIEEEIFKEHEREMVADISHVSQRLIRFRQTLLAHEQALAQTKIYFGELFGVMLASDVGSLERVFRHLTRIVAALSETTVELRETNNTLLNTKQNEIMKTLTIMASVILPLTLLSSIFGMNTVLPLGNIPGDFWVIIGTMAGAGIVLSLFFRQKRWI